MHLYEFENELLIHLSNKFRSFVFILEDHFDDFENFLNSVHFNMVLSLNEMLTQFLTHSLQGAAIDKAMVMEEITKYWIHDIDAFVCLPKAVEEKLKDIGPHVFFYESLNAITKKR